MSEKKKPSPPAQPPPPTEEEIKFGDELAVLPIRNAVLFPGAVAPFDVGREKSVALVEDVDNFPSLAAARLKPGGLLFISYNAMPGWAAIEPLRQLLLSRGGNEGDSLERARQGLELA